MKEIRTLMGAFETVLKQRAAQIKADQDAADAAKWAPITARRKAGTAFLADVLTPRSAMRAADHTVATVVTSPPHGDDARASAAAFLGGLLGTPDTTINSESEKTQ